MRRLTHIVIVALLLPLAAGCKEDPMRKGRIAHAEKNADAAETAFKAVLEEDPDNFEARRLLADVHRFRGDYEICETELEELWKEKGFDEEDAELSIEDSVTKRNMEQQFDELYQQWSDEIDPEEEPEEYVEVLRKGLARDPKSQTLNRRLVEYYFEEAERLVDAGKKKIAAATYDQILELRALKQQREEAKEKAASLRREAYDEEAAARFDDEMVLTLKENEAWDAEGSAAIVSVQAEVDRKLRPRSDDDRAKAREIAVAAVEDELRRLVRLVAAVPKDVEPDKIELPEYEATEEDFRRGEYSLTVTVGRDALLEAGFPTSERVRSDTAEAREDETDANGTTDQPADGPPGEGSTDDGSETP